MRKTNVIDQVMNSYNDFKKSSKKIANFLLKHPDDFAKNTAQELGKAANTSAASIIRFCQQLGFKGLKDFQIELASDLPNNQTKMPDTIINSNDDLNVIAFKLQASLYKNFQDIIKLTDGKRLEKAIDLTKKANQIYIEGIGASSLPAKDLFYKLIRIGKQVCYNDDVHIALERSYYSSAKDVMIIFSYSGLTKEIILIAEQAQKNKTPIIAITRNDDSVLKKIADINILLPNKEKLLRIGAINSLFSEMFISSIFFLGNISDNLKYLQNRLGHTADLTNKLKEGKDNEY